MQIPQEIDRAFDEHSPGTKQMWPPSHNRPQPHCHANQVDRERTDSHNESIHVRLDPRNPTTYEFRGKGSTDGQKKRKIP